jgi:hypothetical protein
LFRNGGVGEACALVVPRVHYREGERRGRKLVRSCGKLVGKPGEGLGRRITLAAGSASNPAKVPKPAELLPARARRTRSSCIEAPPSLASASTVECGHASLLELVRRR